MKTLPILGAMALITATSLTSCLSFSSHDDRPVSTTVTKETVVPDPINNPTVVQETTTTRTR